LDSKALLVLTTCGDAAEAEALADALVGESLAACVNVLPRVSSTYRWEGRVEKGQESLLLIKTTQDRFAELEAAIKRRSSYELPEVVAVPVHNGSAEFLGWIADSVAR
jgi:periplasmic divalent cation tolerance protein